MLSSYCFGLLTRSQPEINETVTYPENTEQSGFPARFQASSVCENSMERIFESSLDPPGGIRKSSIAALRATIHTDDKENGKRDCNRLLR
jgi:hypothetical protein